MVSEKKTALDVVYSRLGALSQYALLIDDVGNKDAFYRQLSRMAALGQRPERARSILAGLRMQSIRRWSVCRPLRTRSTRPTILALNPINCIFTANAST